MRGQLMGAQVAVMSPSGAPMGGRLAGMQLTVGVPQGENTVWRLGAMSLAGSGDRSGSICAGFVMPGDACGSQLLRDEGRVMGITTGMSQQLVGGARSGLALTFDLAAARFNTESRSIADGRTIRADILLGGVLLGGEAAWFPLPQYHVAVNLGLSVGEFIPLNHQQALDAYEPFMNGLSASQISLGLTWGSR